MDEFVDTTVFDTQVRAFIYNWTRLLGEPPTQAEAGAVLGRSPAEIVASFRRLAQGRVLVLGPESGEILMAHPFSAVPTPFVVETEWGDSYYANCIWDAMGIPAVLGCAARIFTSCPDCGDQLTLQVSPDVLGAAPGVVHFAVPVARWWENIVFT